MKTADTLSVIAAGDLSTRAPVDSLIGSGNETAVFRDVRQVLERADVRLVNLENPLTDNGKPIAKAGPNLRGPESAVLLLQAGGFDAAVLANNHMGDFGSEGVRSTLAALDAHGIGHTGAGMTLAEARRPWIARRNGLTLAVLASTENEFGTARDEKPGSNGFDMRRLCMDIRQARRDFDFVLVVMHGGNEHNPVPAPIVVDRYRTLIDIGADAVIGMHPHCPQGYEVYEGKPIVYSTGNFLFGNVSLPDPQNPWYYGYMPHIVFGDGLPQMTIHPYRFSPDGRLICLLTGVEKKHMMDYLGVLSSYIGDPVRLKRHYESWCAYKGPGSSRRLRCEWPPDPARIVTDPAFLTLKNGFTCEAHNDLLKTYLQILTEGRLEEAALGVPDLLDLMSIRLHEDENR
ncbi:MAG: CapA family protein [Clostridiales bacterium]|nr:CapA family protein [Clostridiales bacterium]MDD4018455.1 CapA family protein [Kiritimatiellia bacterium]